MPVYLKEQKQGQPYLKGIKQNAYLNGVKVWPAASAPPDYPYVRVDLYTDSTMTTKDTVSTTFSLGATSAYSPVFSKMQFCTSIPGVANPFSDFAPEWTTLTSKTITFADAARANGGFYLRGDFRHNGGESTKDLRNVFNSVTSTFYSLSGSLSGLLFDPDISQIVSMIGGGLYGTFLASNILTFSEGFFDCLNYLPTYAFVLTFQTSKLKSVPRNFLPSLAGVTLPTSCFQYCFMSCANLQTIGENFLSLTDNTGTVSNAFYGMFYGCTALTTPPLMANGQKLYEYYPTTYGSGQCFRNCTALPDFDSIPSTWK